MSSSSSSSNKTNMAGVESPRTTTTTLLDEFRGFEKGGFFDLGHPLLNRITESFIKAAGIGAVQAVSREAFFTAFDGGGSPSELSGAAPKTHNNRFPNLRGETNSGSVEALVKNTGKESMQWGLAAGMYSGITYGLKEARGGTHDWKNSAVAGAVTGAVLAALAASDNSSSSSHEQIVQSAITGAALSTAANLLSGVF